MAKKQVPVDSGRELIEALDQIEKEENISKETVLKAIEESLKAACKNEYGSSDNIEVKIDRQTGHIDVFAVKTVSDKPTYTEDEIEEFGLNPEDSFDPALNLTLADARKYKADAELGDEIRLDVKPKDFGRIAAQKAKQVVVQKIREEERIVLFNMFHEKEKEVVTGIVQRGSNGYISINLGKCDAVLPESEQVRTERFRRTERIKLYVTEVRDTTKGPRITVSRARPELVLRLFEEEVAEIHNRVVEIRSIAREPGSRTKIAVYSNNPDVDPVGACVGLNGARVNAIVNELRGEKIDIVVWSDDPSEYIKNALNPAKAVSVETDVMEKSARVVVDDSQLSLAIGKEGQNARLAARLTGYKIDIRSVSQVEASEGEEEI